MDGNASDDKNIVKLKNIYKILDAVRTGLTVLSLETALLVAGSALAVFFGISISPIVSFVAIGAIVALVLGSGAICGYKVYTTLSEIDSNNDKHGLDYISQKRSRPVILDLEDDSVAKLK